MQNFFQRLLELCRGVSDSRPVDIAKFVADTSAGSPAIVAVAENEVVGLVSSRRTADEMSPGTRSRTLYTELGYVYKCRLSNII